MGYGDVISTTHVLNINRRNVHGGRFKRPRWLFKYYLPSNEEKEWGVRDLKHRQKRDVEE